MAVREINGAGLAEVALLVARRAAWTLLFLLAVALGAVVIHNRVSNALGLFENPKGRVFGPAMMLPVATERMDDLRQLLVAFAKEHGFVLHDHGPAIAAASNRHVFYVEMVHTGGDLRIWATNVIDTAAVRVESFRLKPSAEAVSIADRLMVEIGERWPDSKPIEE